MARNRIIYQSEAVYCSQNVAYNAEQTGDRDVMALNRVQSANYSFNVARQDINQFGDLAAIDRVITEAPTVSFDTSWYLANFTNESRCGFFVTQSGMGEGAAKGNTQLKSCITNIIDSASNAQQKNWYILTTKEGKDATAQATAANYESIVGIGNAFLTSYSSEAAVGGLPTVSVSVEGQNMNFVNVPISSAAAQAQSPAGATVWAGGRGTSTAVTYVSGESPAVNPTDGTKYNTFAVLPKPEENASGAHFGLISSLRPGDVTLTLAKKTSDAVNTAATGQAEGMVSPDYAGASISDAHIQSYTLGFDLSRTPIQKLGSKFAFARSVDFPITVSLSIDAVLAELTTGSLADIIDCDNSFDARIALKDPVCGGATKAVVCNYIVKGLKLDSESYSSDIGSNKTVTLDFSAQVGGPDQSGQGVFMSGFYNGEGQI